ncbi:DUF92 domain-containing protein [Haladaptatus caseinilyticus]|uniref:DUF92 domain-containing protein n=1 Tax=Haladaptatus caseinilyticus TaxID=2993314 RepID=UPI00224B08C4|nr:DUF92 domain-containing protein [Haladaptatus caseinilyticus]
MTTSIRRAAAFAAVGTVALVGSVLVAGVAALFAAIGALALVVDDGVVFDLFARPSDRSEGRLRGLAAFSFATAGLAMLVIVVDLPTRVFVAAVCLLVYGNLVEQVARSWSNTAITATAGFTVGGFVAAFAAQVVVLTVSDAPIDSMIPILIFLAASGALLAGLLRSVLFERDDPLVMFSVALLLWLFADLTVTVTPLEVAIAIAVTVGFGYISWALDAASVTGMLTGVLLALLTIVLGGYPWFAVLISFFALGALSTKFRYEQKRENGVAEANEGARGGGNVLGNAAVALFAVLAFAASDRLPVANTVFLFAFAGSIATAMSDTLSSEIGGVFDNPRLITTLKRVEPGTDGGVTWQGELAGALGAIVVAVIAVTLFGTIGPLGGIVIAMAGIGGMTVDSLLGATIEGERIGNQSVNFLATLSGALLGAGLSLLVGLPA